MTGVAHAARTSTSIGLGLTRPGSVRGRILVIAAAAILGGTALAPGVAIATGPSAARSGRPAPWGRTFSPRVAARGSINLRAVAARPSHPSSARRAPRYLARPRSSIAGPSSGPSPRIVAPPAPVQATISSNPAAAQPGVQGLSQASGPSTTFDPPDPWLGVGPDSLVQVVNTSLRVTDRAGANPVVVSLADFFGISGQGIANTDPRVIYDSLHGRWIASEVEWDCAPTGGAHFGHGYLDMAVSATSDPAGTWSLLVITYNDALPDYAAVGTSTDKVGFAGNLFNLTANADCTAGGAYAGADIVVMDWAQLLSPTTLPFDEYGTDATRYTPRVALQAPATAAPLMVVLQRDVSVAGSMDVAYATISGLVGSGGGTTMSPETDLSAMGIVQPFLDPISPRQPSGTVTTAIDSRPTDAIWQDGRLTFVSTQACTPTGDSAVRDCVRVSQLGTATATPTLVQDFLVAQAGEDSYMGGVGVSGSGGLFVAWTRSSAGAGDYPSSMAAYQLRTDPADSISPPEVLAAGQANHAGGRWGDYVGVAQDPQDPYAVWQANEYGSSDTGWATYVSALDTGTGTSYVPITPARVLDTRVGTGLSGVFSANVARTFAVAGHGGVPAGAVAVTGNLTVTGQTGPGYVSLTVAPTNTPSTSSLNFPVGDNRANNVTIPLSTSGGLSAVYKAPAGRTTQLIFDVTGYFLAGSSGATYHTVAPARILDTRSSSTVGPYATPFRANQAREFPVWNHGGIPSTASAITGNLTVTNQTSLGFLSLGPVDTNAPSTSTLNFPIKDNRANGVSVALTATGSLFAVYGAPAGNTADVIFDVTGYYVPGAGGQRFYPLNPGRRLDGRTGIDLGLAGPFSANSARSLAMAGHLAVPVGSTAVTGNLTVTGQTQPGFAAVTPDPTNNPTTSSINFPVGDNRANGVTVPLNGSGDLSLVYKAASGSTYLLLDVTGYFR